MILYGKISTRAISKTPRSTTNSCKNYARLPLVGTRINAIDSCNNYEVWRGRQPAGDSNPTTPCIHDSWI